MRWLGVHRNMFTALGQRLDVVEVHVLECDRFSAETAESALAQPHRVSVDGLDPAVVAAHPHTAPCCVSAYSFRVGREPGNDSCSGTARVLLPPATRMLAACISIAVVLFLVSCADHIRVRLAVYLLGGQVAVAVPLVPGLVVDQARFAVPLVLLAVVFTFAVLAVPAEAVVRLPVASECYFVGLAATAATATSTRPLHDHHLERVAVLLPAPVVHGAPATRLRLLLAAFDGAGWSPWDTLRHVGPLTRFGHAPGVLAHPPGPTLVSLSHTGATARSLGLFGLPQTPRPPRSRPVPALRRRSASTCPPGRVRAGRACGPHPSTR